MHSDNSFLKLVIRCFFVEGSEFNWIIHNHSELNRREGQIGDAPLDMAVFMISL